MAATKYQVLYRYINESTNTRITNSPVNTYEIAQEFITNEHQLESSNLSDRIEGEDKREAMISFGNSPTNPKTDMLFAYDGTKKIRHEKFIPTDTGYVIRDWKRLNRKNIGNLGDFSKDYTTLDAVTPELGGTVVCKNKNIFDRYFPTTITVIKDNTYADKEGDKSGAYEAYYTEAKINELINNATPFALNTASWREHAVPSNYVLDIRNNKKYYKPTVIIGAKVKLIHGPISIPTSTYWVGYTRYRYTDVFDYVPEDSTDAPFCFSAITIDPSQVQTTSVPGHYEPSSTYPYLIKDTYKRIELDPWFINGTYSSLESALEKCRILVNMIGIDNVKLIKIVPFDQFIRIK